MSNRQPNFIENVGNIFLLLMLGLCVPISATAEVSSNESQLRKLESQVASLADSSEELRENRGNSFLYFQASDLLSDTAAICTARLLEQSFALKERCQDVKRTLANLQKQSKPENE